MTRIPYTVHAQISRARRRPTPCLVVPLTPSTLLAGRATPSLLAGPTCPSLCRRTSGRSSRNIRYKTCSPLAWEPFFPASPKWRTWQLATPDRPCTETAAKHIGGSPTALAAARLQTHVGEGTPASARGHQGAHRPRSPAELDPGLPRGSCGKPVGRGAKTPVFMRVYGRARDSARRGSPSTETTCTIAAISLSRRASLS